MTQQKNLKRRIRARMAETGESYTAARRAVLAGSEVEADPRGRKNYDARCQVCDATPTVGDTKLCGPCCFGEADTAGGNW